MKSIFKIFMSYIFILNISTSAYAETAVQGPTKIELELVDNSIVPKNINDPSIIYLKESLIDGQKHISFIYCKNKNSQNNCLLLGGKSFSIAKLEEFSRQVKLNEESNLKRLAELRKVKEENQRKTKIAAATFLGGWYTTAVILLYVSSGTLIGSLIVGLLTLIPGGWIATKLDYNSIMGIKNMESEYDSALRIANSNLHFANWIIRSPNKSYIDLSHIAQSLHEYLYTFDNQTNRTLILNP